MLKKSLILGLMLLGFSATPWAQGGGMGDKQVKEYVEMGLKQGKSQQQIATELARRGVTREQAERVKKLYEQGQSGKGTAATAKVDRKRTNDNLASDKEYVGSDFDFENEKQKSGKVNRFITTGEISEGQTLTLKLDENGNLVSDNITIFKEEAVEDQVFGRNIFNTNNLTFEPSTNLPTPSNYRLGAGDQVIIDIWGTSQVSIQETISPDGAISIDNLGLVFLNGMTVNQATSYLRKELNKIYAGLSDEEPTSHIKVSLGNSRTIQVNVMGEVYQPGTYALSAFSTVFHALYSAGGVSEIGSLRNIQVVRNGKTIANVDVYDFIMQGKTKDDIALQEGDVIIVSPYEALVKIEGNVKRPMKYEMKSNETVSTLLKYAGNFSSDAYTRSMKVVRQNGKEYQIFTVDDMDYSVFQLKDGDVITAEAILNRFENKLEIKGAVYRPGIYQFGGDLNTVKQLVEKADGVMADAFLGRAVLHRQREDLTREIIQVDMKGILNGTKPDIALKRNDVLYIPSIHDLKDLGNVEVFGEVARPGKYVFADNMTLEDLIIQAGGLLESASTVKVDVSRRIKNSKSTEMASTIGEMYTFALKDGFVVDGEAGFVLEPYDQVYVRRSPGYQQQVNVTVTGEILYDGTYALTNKSERLSDLVKKAGGVTPYAYVKGAKLMRKANAEEIARMKEVLEMMQREMGNVSMDSLKLETTTNYSVGIDLEAALKNPGSDADIVLREGDQLILPELVNTVKINGAVMFPNTVAYNKKMTVKDYISQAGGYANGARKTKAFIIYMNGQVAKVNGAGRSMVEPGCEIIVPIKDKTKAEKWNLQSILGIATSLSSLGLTAASVANILK
ncbi:MAG: SLBB domain-containing protein [Bacteroidaceae bacterium]|nr:SLBB domain-containing protein [Bacteroidaceae bacterium]